MRSHSVAPGQLGAPKSHDAADDNVLHSLGVDTFSAVFNLCDFAPEPLLGGPDWKMPFNGREVKAHTALAGQWERGTPWRCSAGAGRW